MSNELENDSNVRSFPMKRTCPLRPPPEYGQLRKEEPLSKAKIWDGSLVWLATLHKDVCKVLSDSRFSKVRTHPGFPETGPGGKAAAIATKPTFVDMDPPEHTHHRSMVEKDFSEEKVQSMRLTIENITNELINEIIKKDQPIDLHTEYSLAIPTRIIYDILGISYKDREYLEKCNAIRTNGSATSAQSSTASKDLMNYLSKLIEEKEKNPSDDLLSRLGKEQVKTGELTHDELVSMAFLLLVAGNATTANMITLGILTLLQNPEELNQLKQNPSLIKNTVQEILRFLTGSQFATRRVAIQDIEINNIIIKKNEGVWALNASANEDENIFNDPTKFDIHRNNANEHLAYGYGIHKCIAYHLANAEIEIAINTIIQRLPNLKINIPFDQINYINESSRDFGVTSLPIQW